MQRTLAYQHILWILLFYLIPLGCEEVVQVELDQDSGQIFIDATIEKGKPPKVIIGTTSPYYYHSPPQRISDAEVALTELNENIQYQLKECEIKGEYTHPEIKGKVNCIYQLEIKYRGKIYTAMDSLYPVPPIEKIKIDFADRLDKNRSIIINFQDPPTLGNYYRWVSIFDDYRLLPAKHITISDDRLFNGALVKDFNVYNGRFLERCRPGAKVQLLQVSLSQTAYKFYRQLQTTGEPANLFSAPPANLPTNFDNGALGFFRAIDVFYSAEIIIPESSDSFKEKKTQEEYL